METYNTYFIRLICALNEIVIMYAGLRTMPGTQEEYNIIVIILPDKKNHQVAVDARIIFHIVQCMT